MQKSYFARNRWKLWLAPWLEMDWLLLLLIIGLTAFGGIVIRSTELQLGYTDWWQHWIVGGIGTALALFFARCRYENLINWKWVIYGVTNASLIAVMVIGTEALGAQRWITIGSFNIQPSEFAKLGMIITLAALLEQRTADTIPAIVKTLAITGVPWALVFIQPDLGTSLVFGAITLPMLYWGNANPGWLILMVSPLVSAILCGVYFPGWLAWVNLMGLVGWRSFPQRWFGALGGMALNLASGELGTLLWKILKDYQKDRIILFLNPERDPLGGGYHLIQSRIAIGAGELWGQGLYKGAQTQGNFIPEQHTDFIFSAIGEEFGFVGGVILLFVFWLICLRLVMIAQNAKDNFGSLLAIGVLAMIVFQTVVNIGMTIGLAPVTGIPLPWLSYGRSAMLTNFMAIGIVESVARSKPERKF
ncbi:MAG TPA: rod shape-determining protein RodA [Oscillatoriaceae cyanobacterium M33_DOE_052]|uniref:Peptidoglycan glycosyltransferase RodA n=1 Tax=Planktothricoides sp. SpSt-374 TaxID=2282167 RepID=A0A7C4A0K0_9CYAN|nr:rod shape-determining protein RodA [Oscillatoriaceae cyanobacterium M33_DOE_052]